MSVETPEINYFPTLLGYARELDTLANRRRIHEVMAYFAQKADVSQYAEVVDSFYQRARYDIHINHDVMEALVEGGGLLTTRFSFEGMLGLQDEQIVYGSVRTYQNPKPFRVSVGMDAVARGGLFFPLFPGVYFDKLELVSAVTTLDGLASMAISQALGMLPGDVPEMILIQSHCSPIEEYLIEASLPEDPAYDSWAFALRRRGLHVRRVSISKEN